MANLSKVKIPNDNTTYYVIDENGRKMIATNYTTGVAYSEGDYVIYNDNFYLVTADISAANNTAWSAMTASGTSVGAELQAIKTAMSTGIHYRGYTTTALTDGSTTNPIKIRGKDYTAVAGDLVIAGPIEYQTVSVTSSTFEIDGTFEGSYDGYLYTKSGDVYTKVTSGTYDSGTTYYGTYVDGQYEYIFDGTQWEKFGTDGTLKALAFADTASGTSSVNVTGTAGAQTFTGTQATISISGSTSGVGVSMTPDSSNKVSITPFATGGSFTPGTTPVSVEMGTGANAETLIISTGTAPSYTAATGGTPVEVLKSLPTPSVTQGTFSGSTTYTPAGSNAASTVPPMPSEVSSSDSI